MSKREWQRHRLNKVFDCVIAGGPGQIKIFDMSVGGCMGRAFGNALQDNDTVEIDLHGFAKAHGHVVWRSNSYVGLRFDPPIHDAVVRYLGFSPSRMKFEDIEPRDQFGRRLTLPERPRG